MWSGGIMKHNITWGTILTDFCIFQSLCMAYAFWITRSLWRIVRKLYILVWVGHPSLAPGQWSGEKSRDTKLQSVLFLIQSHLMYMHLYLACTPGAQAGSGWPKILGKRKRSGTALNYREGQVRNGDGGRMRGAWGSPRDSRWQGLVGMVGIYLAKTVPFCRLSRETVLQ